MFSEPEVSVVIPTYNRSALLRDAMDSVLRQDDECTFEIVVVDNNSNDDTKALVHSVMEDYPGKVRYVFESRQGNAYARNRGIESAKGAVIAFIDDDVTVESNWLKSLTGAFESRGELSFVGGRVLPRWSGPPPSWLNSDHWAPLALLDYGSDELSISGKNPRGLLTANIAFRRSVFDDVGMFSPDLQRVNDGIGSMEDHEFLMRVCRTGRIGVYIPDMVARAPVEIGRLSKEYHRRWHTGHGHFYGVMRDPEWERSKFHLIGVPSHLYKETANHALFWLLRIIKGDTDAAFVNECRLRFFRGFLRQRSRHVNRQ